MTGYEIADALDKFAEEQGFRPADAYYIVGEFNLREPNGKSVYSDEAHLWCHKCAVKHLSRARRLMPRERRADHFICHTDARGEDTTRACMRCGKRLNYSLSKYGVESELEHFAMYPPHAPIRGGEAWDIARIIEAAPDNEEALALGRAALKAAGIECEEVTP
jgi:hypothetical protein